MRHKRVSSGGLPDKLDVQLQLEHDVQVGGERVRLVLDVGGAEVVGDAARDVPSTDTEFHTEAATCSQRIRAHSFHHSKLLINLLHCRQNTFTRRAAQISRTLSLEKLVDTLL